MSVRLAVILYRNEQGIVVPPQVLATDNNGSTYVMFRATAGATPANVPAVPGQAITQGVEVQGLQAAPGASAALPCTAMAAIRPVSVIPAKPSPVICTGMPSRS